MVNLRTHLLALAAILFCWAGLHAQITATDAFTSAPRKVLPLLDTNARLDMVDYFQQQHVNRHGQCLRRQVAHHGNLARESQRGHDRRIDMGFHNSAR